MVPVSTVNPLLNEAVGLQISFHHSDIRPGEKTSGFGTVRTLKIFRTSGPDVMSGRALV